MKVRKGSPLIDEVQALHAGNRNGLAPLDFRHPGEFCANSKLCKLVCLVCGEAMVDGEDPEFGLFLDVFGGYSSDEEIDVATNHEVKVIMKALDLVWTSQWSTPIHKRCSKKAVCKCVVALGTVVCPVHKTSVDREGLPSLLLDTRALPPKRNPLPSLLPSKEPIVSALISAPAARTSTKVGPFLTPRKVLVMKADWLPPPSTTAQTVHFDPRFNPSNAVPVMKETPGTKGKQVKQPVKSIKTVRLEQAAATCAYKIDAWTAVHPTNKNLDTPLVASAQPRKAGFSLEEHYRLFDPDQHGWMKIKGMKGFMHYNGVFVPTEHDVICIHEDGTITPG